MKTDEIKLEIVNRVFAHLKKQGEPAFLSGPDGKPECAYRYMGKACFAGALVSDECYEIDLENRTVVDEKVLLALLGSNPQWGLTLQTISEDFRNFLRLVQQAHDGPLHSHKVAFNAGTYTNEHWKADAAGRLVKLAEEHGLPFHLPRLEVNNE